MQRTLTVWSRARRAATGAAGLALLAAAACRTVAIPPPRPVPPEASRAFVTARELARSTDEAARSRAMDEAELAAALAPDWVAPRRLSDELMRSDLRGVEALAAHRSALAERPDDPLELYLAGRLEGGAGLRRFAQATEVAPGLAWGWHGLAYASSLNGDRAEALRNGERALALARDPWERAFFAAGIARYLVLDDRPEDALDVLDRALQDRDLAQIDRLELEVQTAEIELSMLFSPEASRGRDRALGLLRECDLTDGEIDSLVKRLRVLASFDAATSLELSQALAARPGAARDRLRAALMIDERSTPLALALLSRAREAGARRATDGPLLRAARYSAGQYRTGVEEWLADLPVALRDSDGRPRDARIAAVLDSARAAPTARAAGADELAALGDALISAGWFPEARAVAAALAEHDLDRALALEDRAATGLEIVHGMRRVLLGVDLRDELRTARGTRKRERPDFQSLESREIADLDGLLAAFAPLFARAGALTGGETRTNVVAAELEASPRLSFGPVGALVHPGPWFSNEDQSEGLGRAGEPVPGLAAALKGIGRFGIFGEMFTGGGPDGAMLARVCVEERQGEHLGVAWEGTVAWCDGADLESRAGRAGASIAGAALHEGYWIDLDVLRREREAWRELERLFAAPDQTGAMERALATRGLELEAPREFEDLRRSERRSADILLGEAERVRLALLRDRAADRAAGRTIEASTRQADLVTLDDLALTTALHEEGHLCDRTRFLPISSHLGRAFAFLAACSFSAQAVAERLEYRAELVALCEAPDPRLPLSDILQISERSDQDLTPHASAYRRLLADFVGELDRRLAEDPAAWPQIDPDRVLVQELHRLTPAEVRQLARSLARREGLFDK